MWNYSDEVKLSAADSVVSRLLLTAYLLPCDKMEVAIHKTEYNINISSLICEIEIKSDRGATITTLIFHFFFLY